MRLVISRAATCCTGIEDRSRRLMSGKVVGAWQQQRGVRGRDATDTCLLLGSLCRPLLPRLGCCLLRSPHFLGLGPLGRQLGAAGAVGVCRDVLLLLGLPRLPSSAQQCSRISTPVHKHGPLYIMQCTCSSVRSGTVYAHAVQDPHEG